MVRKRPDVFNQQAFEGSLRRQGCAESFISPTVSDFRLFVPVIIRELGEGGILEIMEKNRAEIHLGDAKTAWSTVI